MNILLSLIAWRHHAMETLSPYTLASILRSGYSIKLKCLNKSIQNNKQAYAWWRHQMETSPRYWPFCAGNSPVTGKFPTQKPVTRSFDVFFHLCLNKQLSKQSWGWWFETPSHQLWRHCNSLAVTKDIDENSRVLKHPCTKYPDSIMKKFDFNASKQTEIEQYII